MKARLVLLLLGVGGGPLAAGAEWRAGIGLAVFDLPDYRGAAQRQRRALPFPYFYYRGERLWADRDGLGLRLIGERRLRLTLSAAATPLAAGDDNRARRGMPELAPTAELGPALHGRWREDDRLRLELAHRWVWAFAGGPPEPVGRRTALGLRWNRPGAGGEWRLSGGLLWGDRKLHAYYYEVDPAYATPTRPAYRARGGYGGEYLGLSWSIRRGRLWLGLALHWDRLDDAVFADSPLVERRRSWAAGLGSAWLLHP
ncbi:MAG: hypothetical protein KatS3mg121_1511 [Gammaproteobacteria bacterium]|nr:MAG: hypothetical protein KatS3mg121_1511 [Gammaproteobacteria bacterium]